MNEREMDFYHGAEVLKVLGEPVINNRKERLFYRDFGLKLVSSLNRDSEGNISIKDLRITYEDQEVLHSQKGVYNPGYWEYILKKLYEDCDVYYKDRERNKPKTLYLKKRS
ncbi:MAG: hypothetical protein IJH18_02990 [Bacilli bacterium]|nr:hypothetical protein [Bacilli bacterium]